MSNIVIFYFVCILEKKELILTDVTNNELIYIVKKLLQAVELL